MPTNDLIDVASQAQAAIQAEYDRIRKRSREDPGTAGDEGEQTWAELLRDWLPAHFHVATKGRIMFPRGEASPQVDVVVLDPHYPKVFLNKKMYLAAGVVAAFECKLTLRSGHLKAAAETVRTIRELEKTPGRSARSELMGQIAFGFLAHSLDDRIDRPGLETQVEEIGKNTEHPRHLLDLVCVANAGSWYSTRWIQSATPPWIHDASIRWSPEEEMRWVTANMRRLDQVLFGYMQNQGDSVVGSALAAIFRRVAWDQPPLREIANYIKRSGLSDRAQGVGMITKPLSGLVPKHTYERLLKQGPQAGSWNEWGMMFP